MKKLAVWTIALTFLSLSACSLWNSNEDDNPYKGIPANRLYKDAQKDINKSEYSSAIKRLEAMESMYPFSQYAETAELNLIYAYYKKEEYTAAAASAERFIHLYPRAKHVDYAYYLKALANFKQVRGILANYVPLDESWRAPGTQQEAYNDFALLVQNFPNSKYKPDAIQRMIYLRNTFARRELNTAKYYFKKKMYPAAIERADFLVKNYSQSPSVKSALAILYYANRSLRLERAAQEALALYQANYQGNPPVIKN